MFKKQTGKLKQQYDQQLLQLIYMTKADWDHAKETQAAVYESETDNELAMNTKLQEKKYLYLYREARRRQVHGQIQPSMVER